MNNSFGKSPKITNSEPETPSRGVEKIDQIKEISLPTGTYNIRFGFPRVYSKDRRYYFGNRPKETHLEPIELDVYSKEFQSLIAQYKNLVQQNLSLVEKVEILKRVIENSVKADPADQPIRKASEIIAQGKGACDSLVLVGGLILDRSGLLQNCTVERIIGASNSFNDTRPHNINHAWLRVSDGKIAVLYDLYYKILRSYDLTKEELVLEEDDPFYAYEVAALGAVDLNHVEGINIIKGPVRIVKNIKNENEAWLIRGHTLAAQVTGEVDYTFTSTGAKLRTVNDAIEVVESIDPKAPRFLVPIQDISATD